MTYLMKDPLGGVFVVLSYLLAGMFIGPIRSLYRQFFSLMLTAVNWAVCLSASIIQLLCLPWP